MYKYYNQNPNGYHIPDCVIRAISLAMGISYYDVISYLHLNGEIFKCDDLNVRCYQKLLDFDFKLPHMELTREKTAGEVAEDFPNNILLLRMPGHLSCSISGVIHDIFDCSEEIVTDFWIVK